MRFDDSEAQKILRTTARSFLAERFPYERLYAIEQGQDAITSADIDAFAGMGWLNLLAPESSGGGGLSLLEAAVVIEEMGYAAVPAPVLVSNVAADLLASAAVDLGLRPSTVSLGRAHRAPAAGDRDSLSASGGKLSGTLPLVPFANVSNAVLAPLTIDGQAAFAALPLDGAQLDELSLIHSTASRVRFDGMPIDRATVLATDAPAEALRGRCEALTTALMLVEQAGLMQRILAMTSQYISNRVQFGQPIAKFQAARHRAAELLMQTDTTRWAAYHALWRFQEDPSDTREIWLTKHWAIRAADKVYQVAHLLHGGVGVGMEYPLHLYTLSMTALAVLGGTMSEMVDRSASRLVGSAS
jgi:alkylation response protein AidB-like acyl-CoA dehydrogenase